MKEKPILFSGQMVRAILEGRKTQTRRLVKPQPPTVEAVKAKSGSDYSWYREPKNFGFPFRPVGPVWAVRELAPEMAKGIHCPYGTDGDRLWVRETFDIVNDPAAWHPDDGPKLDCGYVCPDAIRRGPNDERWVVDYAADNPNRIMDRAGARKWRPSIFMPRWASRITLTVNAVRCERLREINWLDIASEGFGPPPGRHHVNSEETRRDREQAFLDFASLWDNLNPKAPWESNPFVWVLSFSVENLSAKIDLSQATR